MRRMKLGAAFGLVAVLLVAVVAFAGVSRTNITKFDKATGGGATGDSATAAADVSDGIIIPSDVANWFVTVACDSTAIYTTQVSPDSTYWYTVDTDTVTGGSAEATALFENGIYAGWYIRVTLDPIPGAAPYGANWFHWNKEKE